MDRLFDLNRVHVARLAGLLVALGASGCEERASTPSAAAPSRFQSVKDDSASKRAGEAFCEKVFPSSGETARRWSEPPARPLPKRAVELNSAEVAARAPARGWTWINLWASWCGPCVKELPLLKRWRESLAKDGVPVRFELWSVDATESELESALGYAFPGELRWVKDEAELPALLEGLGVDKGSAIPVHALVDPAGQLRCVRVGSIGEEAYGSVKAILAGG